MLLQKWNFYLYHKNNNSDNIIWDLFRAITSLFFNYKKLKVSSRPIHLNIFLYCKRRIAYKHLMAYVYFLLSIFWCFKNWSYSFKKWSKKIVSFPLWKKLHFKYCNKKGRLKRQFFSVVVQQESFSVSYFCEILPKHGNRYKDMQIG